MTIAEAQQQIDMWIRQHGVRYFNELTNTVLLMEEVGEFSRLVARIYGEQSFRQDTSPTDQKEALADEMSDILFVLVCLANQMQIDLGQALQLNLEKKTLRDRERHAGNEKLR